MNDTVKAPIANLADFTALDPFFRIIEQGLAGLVQPGHFFDLLAEDITVDCVVTRYISVLTLRGSEVVHWRDYLDPVAVFDAIGWPR